ncbi:hypothetical protein GJAV_G00133220 [Gymnothorax javanicus]|nr:hypothetical protein GJAV_G00133220 [Gymnothorax javanicus]
MDAVNAFNQELFSLMDMKPPISRAKMISITKSAIKAIKLYKHVVQIVEKFIKKCKPEYKIPGLYVVDSIVRQSRHQFGADKDVFGPRFTKNITGTFESLYLCPIEDRSKIVRVLNLWQKNGVFKIEVIQPLLDMAAASSSSTALPDVENNVTETGSPSAPVKASIEPQPPVSSNSVMAAEPQPQNSDALAAVAQLFQSSEGHQLQQMLQTFQQPVQPHSPAVENSTMTQHPGLAPVPVPVPVPTPAPAAAAQFNPLAPPPVEQKAAFDKVTKILDRFDYDDEPEAAEDAKKDDSTSGTPLGHPDGTQQQQQGFPQIPAQIPAQMIPGQMPNMEHFPLQTMGLTQGQISLPPNGQIPGYGVLHGQPFPGMMQPMGQALLQPATVPPGFPGVYPLLNEGFTQHMTPQAQDVSMEVDPPLNKEPKNQADGKSTSRSPSRSPKRRRSRSNSRSRRSRHRRSRSQSRDRRRHSPRSRSQERRERERERERRQKGLPGLKKETLSVCSTTLWVGQLDKRTQQQDVACLLEEFGQIESINMIPPRGCAYIVMVHRQDAFRALQKLVRGSYKVNQKAIKIAWALNKGIKPEYKQYWDVELGVTYIPWSKVRAEDLESFREGGMLDSESLCPDWKDGHTNEQKPDEVAQNGRSESMQVEETPPAVPVQVPPVQPMGAVGALQPPTFPMGLPPPNFPPGVPPPPPPPFMRPGFNPMQMPPGFMPPGPMPPMAPQAPVSMPPSGAAGSSVEDPSKDAPGPRNSSEGGNGSKLYGLMPPQMGNQVGAPGMNMQPPSGGLLGARPGMIPLQRPPGVPPPHHMQRFPGHPPPRPNMPPMPPPPMMHRGPPPQMPHREPPPSGFGMPPPHPVRGPPFPPHGPPFMRPRGPDGGPDERDERPFRNERPGFGREREPEHFGSRRPFGAEGPEQDRERERFGGRLDEAGWERERRDWGLSPERERERGGRDITEDGPPRRPAPGHRNREPGVRERTSRWDRDDRREMAEDGNAPSRHPRGGETAASEPCPRPSTQNLARPEMQPKQEPEPTAQPTEETLVTQPKPGQMTEPAEKPQEGQS